VRRKTIGLCIAAFVLSEASFMAHREPGFTASGLAVAALYCAFYAGKEQAK